MAITPTKAHSWQTYLGTKEVNLATDSFKMVLTTAAPVAATTTKYSELTGEITTAGGYTTGGLALTTASAANSSGDYVLKLTDKVFTATSTAADNFRYAVLIDDTPTDKPVVQWYDYGVGGLTLAVGESVTFDFDGSAGTFKLAY
jgi:hypothetical protein